MSARRGPVPGGALRPLSGGVSSDIWLVEDGDRRFVLKRARPKLDVPGDWYADTSRNRFEQDFIRYVGSFLPDAVPRILHADTEQNFFTMEYLGENYANWKSQLLDGKAEAAHAARAADILSAIHRHSWNDPEARRRFDSLANFRQLRIDPYLLTTGKRHPLLQSLFEAEAERLANTSLCLVHGDFSPKNILIGPGRMVLLDCEVAWFGDPAFDLAFLLNHFFLKALLFNANPQPFLKLAETAWQTYQNAMDAELLQGLEQRTSRLLLMLMLARVDGKSPVEYLADEPRRQVLRDFVASHLPGKDRSIAELVQAWSRRLAGE